jgi:hypothetical protein
MFQAVTDRPPTTVEDLGDVASRGRGRLERRERAGAEQQDGQHDGGALEPGRAPDPGSAADLQRTERHRIDATYEQLARAEATVEGLLLFARTTAYVLLVLWAHRTPAGVQVLTGALLADFVGCVLRTVLFWELVSLGVVLELLLYGLVFQFGLLSQPLPIGDSVVEGKAVAGLAFLAVFSLRIASVLRERLGPDS